MPDWVVIVLRSLFALTALYTITRILGKKQISELTYFEYIMGIVLGELAGFLSTDIESHYLYGLVAMTVWFSIPLTLELLMLKSRKLRRLFEGKGRVLIRDGRVMENNLKKERLNADELMEQLRGKGVFRLEDVEYAMMETDGQLSTLIKKNRQPLTPGDLNLQTGKTSEPQVVIMDGKLLQASMKTANLTKEWLEALLKKKGLNVEDVFLAQVDENLELYLDLYEDKLPLPPEHGKSLLLNSLKKVKADLELYADATSSHEARSQYDSHAKTLEQIISSLNPSPRSPG